MTALLLKHTSTIECDCLLGEHTGQSDKCLEEALILAAAAESECVQTRRKMARLTLRSLSMGGRRG